MSGHRGLDRERLALEVRRAFRPFVVVTGMAVAALAAVSVIFSNIGVTWPWTDTYRTSIAVDDASGIVDDKQEVRFAGVVVGRTGEVRMEDGQAVVGIKIDGEHGPLYKDARIRVRPETPLDDLYVNIERRGTPAAGELGEDDVLPTARTRTPVDVSEVLNVFEADTRTKVEQAIDGYGRGLGDHGDDLRRALVELAPFLSAAKQLSDVTASRRTQTRRLVHNFRLMTEELAGRDADVKRLVATGAGSLGQLGAKEAQIAASLTELPPTLALLQSSFRTLRTTADSLDPAFDALRPVADALPKGLAGLQRVGAEGEPALRKLRDPLPQVRSLTRALRPTARDLSTSFVTLRPTPARLDDVTKQFAGCLDELQQFFHHTISLGKLADRRSVVLRGQAVVGANSAAGAINDPNQTAAPSCVPGGPGGQKR